MTRGIEGTEGTGRGIDPVEYAGALGGYAPRTSWMMFAASLTALSRPLMVRLTTTIFIFLT